MAGHHGRPETLTDLSHQTCFENPERLSLTLGRRPFR